MATYTMLTDIGLDKIAETSTGQGMYIEISRWVGAFDAQLHTDYTAGLSALYHDISNYTDTKDTYPNQYSVGVSATQNASYLGNDDFVNGALNQGYTIYWTSGIAPADYGNPELSNLYSGVTYNHVGISNLNSESEGSWGANTNTYPSNPTNGDWWTVSAAGTIYEDNENVGVTYCLNDIMAYLNSTWVNATDGNGGEHFRGHFTIPVQSKGTETLFINKLGCYAVVRDSLGVVYGNPFLLGQVIIPDPQAIQPKSGASVDTLYVEFQLDAQSALVNFDEYIYSSQNDYWKQVAAVNGSYGLQYEGNAYITQQLSVDDLIPNDNPDLTVSSTDLGVAKLMVSTFHTLNSPTPDAERDLPQLVLQHVDNESIIDRRIRTTLQTTINGDCEIDLYGACSDNEYYSFIPATDKIFGLGNKNNRWKSLNASDNIDLYWGEYIAGNDGAWDYINNSDTTTTRYWRTNTSLRDNDYQDLTIYGNIEEEWGYVSLRNNYMSSNTNLGMAYFGNTSVFVGPHYDSRDVISDALGFKENYFYTYSNISNYLVETVDNSGAKVHTEYPLCVRSTQNINLYTISTDNLSKYDVDSLSTYGGYDSLGVTMEIWNMIKYGSNRNSENFVANFTGIADGISTIYNSFFKESDYDTYGKYATTIEDVRDLLYGENAKGISKDILFASSRYIYTFGDIIPMVDGLNNLGSWNYNFGSLHIETLHGGNKNLELTPQYDIKYSNGIVNYADSKHITVDASLYPQEGYQAIGRNPYITDPEGKGIRWREINCKQLGNSEDYIDTGYIANSYATILRVSGKAYTNNLISSHIDCKDINPITAIENGQYNINIGAINGISIEHYLRATTSYSSTYTLNDVLISEDSKIGVCDINFKISALTNDAGDDVVSFQFIIQNPKDLYMYAKNRYESDRTTWNRLFEMDITDVVKGLIGDTLYNNAISKFKYQNLILDSGSEVDKNHICGGANRNMDESKDVNQHGRILIQMDSTSINTSGKMVVTFKGNWNQTKNVERQTWQNDGGNFNNDTGSLICI